VKSRVLSVVALAPLFFLNSTAWADDDGHAVRPHISEIGGDDHSPGVTIVIFATLLLIGFGVGYIVGRKTRRK